MLVLAHAAAVLALVAGPLLVGRVTLARMSAVPAEPSGRGAFALGLGAGLFAAAGVVLLGRLSTLLFLSGILPAPSPDRAVALGAVLQAVAVVVAEGLARRWAFRRAGPAVPARWLGRGFGAAQAALAGLVALGVMVLAHVLQDGTQGDLVALGFDPATAPRVALKLDAWWQVDAAVPLLAAGWAMTRVCLEVGLAAFAGRALARGTSPWLPLAALQLPFALAEELARALAPGLAEGQRVLMVTYGALGLAGVWMARAASGRPAR
ncbi:MAG: hypothetical protein AAF447_10945 [Myxococcota bacterium]